MNKYEAMHQRNLVRYAKQIDEIFAKAAAEAARMGVSVENIMQKLNKDLFAFKDYPILQERIDALMEKLHDDIELCVLNGVEHEWTLANNKHNELSRRVFGNNIGRLTDAQYQRYFNNHGEALDAFKGRQVAGLNLSDRVWNYTDMFKEQIEAALTVSLGQGKAANRVASELKQYLKYPDKLFRRVRDEYGNLVPSKAMQEFQPGRGVYKSSYMNARRLAVTETNIAYRTSDHLRIQDEDFVVGIKIVLSNNHNCKGVPAGMFFDICDELQGNYPKDFKFTGWHPHCRCHVETILKTEKEMDEDLDRMLRGEEPKQGSVNEVHDMPGNFTQWISDNKERIENAKSVPYFIRDNYKNGIIE